MEGSEVLDRWLSICCWGVWWQHPCMCLPAGGLIRFHALPRMCATVSSTSVALEFKLGCQGWLPMMSPSHQTSIAR